MALDRDTLISLVSDGTGNPKKAAEALGIQAKSIRMWRVDEQGQVVSRRVKEAVLAALMRRYWRDMRRGRKPTPVPAEIVEELLALDE